MPLCKGGERRQTHKVNQGTLENKRKFSKVWVRIGWSFSGSAELGPSAKAGLWPATAAGRNQGSGTGALVPDADRAAGIKLTEQ